MTVVQSDLLSSHPFLTLDPGALLWTTYAHCEHNQKTINFFNIPDQIRSFAMVE